MPHISHFVNYLDLKFGSTESTNLPACCEHGGVGFDGRFGMCYTIMPEDGESTTLCGDEITSNSGEREGTGKYVRMANISDREATTSENFSKSAKGKELKMWVPGIQSGAVHIEPQRTFGQQFT